MSKQIQTVNNSELTSLVSYLIEDYGMQMIRDQFDEVFCLMLEDVPGCERISDKQSKALCERAYKVYVKLTQ